MITRWLLSRSTNAEYDTGQKYSIFLAGWSLSSLLHQFVVTQRIATQIMAAISAPKGSSSYLSAYCICLTSGHAGGEGNEDSEGEDRLMLIDASSNGLDKAL